MAGVQQTRRGPTANLWGICRRRDNLTVAIGAPDRACRLDFDKCNAENRRKSLSDAGFLTALLSANALGPGQHSFRSRGRMSRIVKPFTVPDRAATYCRDIFQRCEDLIQGHIWTGIAIQQLKAWWGNFGTDTEKYFAACLLDALIYRSADQTRALMVQLFQRALPDAMRRRNAPSEVSDDWLDRLRGLQSDPGVRIVPVIRLSDPPTKSGPLVCRQMKRLLGLNDRWMIWPGQVPRARRSGIKVFLFVDDFLGTGFQFRRFLDSMGPLEPAADEWFIYAPLIAHEKGLSRITKKTPFMTLAPVETLDESYSVFSPASPHFDDGENCFESAKNFYLEFLQSRKFTGLGRMTLGYSNLSLVLAFEHATPNASLPILWLPRPSVRPLFAR